MLQGTEKLNADVKSWAANTIGDLKSEFAALNIQHFERSPSPMASRDSLKNSFGQKEGMISRIGFKFPQHMVYVSKGVGKGVPIALAGTGATTRKPKDWFNQVMDKDIDKLADVVAGNMADLVINNLKIR